MKKILLLLTFTCSVALVQSQQCTPDPQFTVAGIYPDSTTGLLPAYVGQSYDQNITIITPTDTSVTLLGIPMTVTIDNIDLISVSGLPGSFNYACDPPSCSFAGGTTACAILSSPSPLSSEIGLHPILFETKTYVSNVPFVGDTTQVDVIDYYYIEVFNTTSTINKFDNTTFELNGVYPNPAANQAKIQFISGVSDNIIFKIYNLLGEEIESQSIFASTGVNTIHLNTSSYSEGLYLYSINNGNMVLTKRMAIKH